MVRRNCSMALRCSILVITRHPLLRACTGSRRWLVVANDFFAVDRLDFVLGLDGTAARRHGLENTFYEWVVLAAPVTPAVHLRSLHPVVGGASLVHNRFFELLLDVLAELRGQLVGRRSSKIGFHFTCQSIRRRAAIMQAGVTVVSPLAEADTSATRKASSAIRLDSPGIVAAHASWVRSSSSVSVTDVFLTSNR